MLERTQEKSASPAARPAGPADWLTGVEVHGQDILSFMGALGDFMSIGQRLLQDLKIGTRASDGQYVITPGVWYALRDKIRILIAVKERVGTTTLRRVGEKIPENALFPPSIVDIHSALRAIDIAYHMNHRKDGKPLIDLETGTITDAIGHYGYQAVPGERRIISICDSPNPSEYDEGILFAMARRFEPKASVVLDPEAPTRRAGGRSCRFVVEW